MVDKQINETELQPRNRLTKISQLIFDKETKTIKKKNLPLSHDKNSIEKL